MKNLLLLPFLFFGLATANATNYYVAANGNDSNSGTSPSSPWKTIAKVNSITLRPGDNVLFNRGDVFYGGITVNQSGTSSAPITYGAYGSGAKPVITGFTSVTSWTNLGGNIWESSSAVSTLPYTNMVTVNGVNTAMGRYPNSEYFYYQSHSGTSSITSNQLTGSPNWKGAELVWIVTTWVMDRTPILSQSGGTLNFSSKTINNVQRDNQGFFIQNDPRTLDVPNEWYYNPSTKKLRIYSSGGPSNVKLSTIETIFRIDGVNYITITDLSINGSNSTAILVRNSKYITVQNNDINFSGGDAILGPYWGNSTNLILRGNNIDNTNNTAVDLSGDFTNPTISTNAIKNSGMLPGMGGNVENSGSPMYSAIATTSANALIENNIIQNSGYVGIKFYGSNCIIQKNIVDGFCKTLHDGGGIYTWNEAKGSTFSGIKIRNNIVLNGDQGIYMDNKTNGVEISGNTVANSRLGVFIVDVWNITVTGNTTFNNSLAGFEMYRNDFNNVEMTDINVSDNVFFAKETSQRTAYFEPLEKVYQYAKADYNYYAKPIQDNHSIDTKYNGVYGYKTLDEIKSITGQELHSKTSPKSITNTGELRFEYNPTSSSKTISLNGNYIDVKANSYNGTITLAPFSSIVLISNGALKNNPPSANAGPDQTITLPNNSISLNGQGMDNDGTVVSYSWSKLSGPNATITNPNSASTTVTSLLSGEYQFVLKVTDNDGAFGLDTVQIIVTSSEVLLPAVSLGNTVNGLEYKYYEGSSYTQLPNFSGTSAVKSGTSDNFDISSANRDNSFAFNFMGYIEVSSDGEYTFYTLSDDGSNLFIDGVKVVDNDGIHYNTEKSGTIGLKAGKHAITVGYFQQSGGKILQVSYAGPGISKQTIPNVALFRVSSEVLLPTVNPGTTVNGLEYKYYEGSSYTQLPNFSGISAVKSGTLNNFDITPANRDNAFAFNFTGYIEVPTDGQYTFYTMSDDGSSLFIDGMKVVDNDGIHYNTEKSGTIGLKAGKHAITVGYFQQSGGKILQVSYSGPGISKQLVPNVALFRVSSEILLPAVNPGNTVNGLEYKYYEASSYTILPNFSITPAVRTSTVLNFDISSANKESAFAFNFKGFIDVPSDGQYTFYTLSDDGSNLYIDGVKVVDNDGVHYNTEKSGKIGLQAGKHSIAVGYFQQTGGKIIQVSYAGPGVAKQLIPSSKLYRVTSQSSASRIIGNLITTDATQINSRSVQNLDSTFSIKLSIKAYPNPFNEFVNLIISGGAGIYQLNLLDATGRIIWKKAGSKETGDIQQTIPTIGLKYGVYFIRVMQKQEVGSLTIIKQ